MRLSKLLINCKKVMKYKVGDKVRIKSLDWYNKNKDNLSFYTDSMALCFANEIVTIKSYGRYPDTYRIDEDEGDFLWTDEMIEGLVEGINDCEKCGLIRNSWRCLFMEHCPHNKQKNTIEVPDGYIVKDENGNIIKATKIVLEKKEIKTVMKIDNEKQELLLGLVPVKDKGQELIPHKDYEIKQDGDKFYLVKKEKGYPKTYWECCDVLRIPPLKNDAEGYKWELLVRFQELLICRDAYWKVAGEDMGLGKPWSPSDTDYITGRYCIFVYRGNIICDTPAQDCILTFPTEEMRDAFYENFKDLIDECKELL